MDRHVNQVRTMEEECMLDFLNLGEMGALALHAMAMLGKTGERMSAEILAQRLNASKHTLHKVAGRLVRAGLLESVRGKSGGLSLALDPAQISLLRVLEATETGAVSRGGCLFARKVCSDRTECFFSELTGTLSRQIRDYFSGTTVADIMHRVFESRHPSYSIPEQLETGCPARFCAEEHWRREAVVPELASSGD